MDKLSQECMKYVAGNRIVENDVIGDIASK